MPNRCRRMDACYISAEGDRQMNKQFRKILLFLLCAGLIPSVLFSGIIGVLLHFYEQSTFALHQSAIDNQKRQCEETLKDLERSTIQFLSFDDLSLSVNQTLNPYSYLAFDRARSLLARIQSYDLPLKNIALVSLPHQWVMTYDGLKTLADSEYKEQIERFRHTNSTSFWYFDGDAKIFLVKKLPINTMEGNGMLLVDIPVSSLQTLTERSERGFPMVIWDEQNRQVIGSGLNERILAHLQEDARGWQQLWQNGVTRIQYDRNDYIVTVLQSEYNKWTYYSVVPASGLYRTLGVVRGVSFGMIAVVLVLTVLFSWVSSRKIYTPIRRVNWALDAAIAGEAELSTEVASEDLDSKLTRVLERFSGIREDLQAQRGLQARSMLSDLFSGVFPHPRAEDLIRYHVTDQNLDGMQMCVVAIRFVGAFEDPGERELWLFALHNILRELLTPDQCLPPCCVNNIFYVVHYMPHLSLEQARVQTENLCGTVIELVERYLPFSVCAGVSNYFSRVERIPFARGESHLSLRACLQSQQKLVFYHEEGDHYPTQMRREVASQRSRILAALEAADQERCQKELMAYLHQLEHIHFYLFKLELGRLLYDLIEFADRCAVPLDSAKYPLILDFDIMSPLSSVGELEQYIDQEFIAKICDGVRRAGGEDEKTVADRMIAFVEAQLEQDISLEACSEALCYNANYLSRVFKTQTGKNYNEYAIEAKIRRCKELLIHSELSVQEIAQRLGYQHSQNLIRVFKRYTALTPGQYREYYSRAARAQK